MTFVWRYMGEPKATITTVPFTDVKSGKYYYKAMLWAYENGIDAGVTETTWVPAGDCTRVAIVTYLYRIETGKGLLNQD
jgi:hypothetical protein